MVGVGEEDGREGGIMGVWGWVRDHGDGSGDGVEDGGG